MFRRKVKAGRGTGEKDANFIPVHYLKLLCEAVEDRKRVAILLGVSESTVHTAMRSGFARKVTELAAEGVYIKDYCNGDHPMPPQKVYAVISADYETMAFIELTVERAGGHYKKLI